MAKKTRTFRLGNDTMGKLSNIARALGVNRTEAVEMLIEQADSSLVKSGVYAEMPDKNWLAKRFQEAVDALPETDSWLVKSLAEQKEQKAGADVHKSLFGEQENDSGVWDYLDGKEKK